MTAKEMFKKLGYEYDYILTDDYYDDMGGELEKIYYENKFGRTIEFCLEEKKMISFIGDEEEHHFALEELKAINKQCEELGWLKED